MNDAQIKQIIDHVQMKDRTTGHLISPVTDWGDLTNVPQLVTTSDVYVTQESQTPPRLGANVRQCYFYHQRFLHIGDMVIFFFGGTFEVNKKMWTQSTWNSPEDTLFYYPDGFTDSVYIVNQITGRPEGNASEFEWQFRNLGDKIIADGFTPRVNGPDPNQFAEWTQVELTGQVTSFKND